MLLEVWDERKFYFLLKYDFNFVDSVHKAAALSTDQIDVENAERYCIRFIDKDGKKKYPIILHCSPSGGVERCIFAILERAYRDKREGRTPTSPLWLSPTQVRIIPLSDKFMNEAEELLEKISAKAIRVDLDDRPITMQKKVREAEKEWIEYIIVIGEREIKSGVLPVRCRTAGKIYFCDNTFGYGNLCFSGADIQPGAGQYYEPDYLAMAGAGLLQKAGG